LLILMPWMYLTISRVTIKEIGTKLVNSRIQLPHLINSYLEREISFPYYKKMLEMVRVETIALEKVSIIWAQKTPITIRPILNSSLDFFCLGLLLFSMILLSTPV
jgi:hypothetical protein